MKKRRMFTVKRKGENLPIPEGYIGKTKDLYQAGEEAKKEQSERQANNR